MIEKLKEQLAEEQLLEFLQKMKEFGYGAEDIIALIQKQEKTDIAI